MSNVDALVIFGHEFGHELPSIRASGLPSAACPASVTCANAQCIGQHGHYGSRGCRFESCRAHVRLRQFRGPVPIRYRASGLPGGDLRPPFRSRTSVRFRPGPTRGRAEPAATRSGRTTAAARIRRLHLPAPTANARLPRATSKPVGVPHGPAHHHTANGVTATDPSPDRPRRRHCEGATGPPPPHVHQPRSIGRYSPPSRSGEAERATTLDDGHAEDKNTAPPA
jgi:hypothetical protein